MDGITYNMKEHLWLGIKRMNKETSKVERYAWECGRCRCVYPKPDKPPFQECPGNRKHIRESRTTKGD